MADFSSTLWVPKSLPALTAAQLNRIEAGIKDAAQNSKQSGTLANRPAASAANKNWVWVDSDTGYSAYSDGTKWLDMGGEWAPVEACAVTDITAAPGANVDGYGMSAGQRVLIAIPNGHAKNGIWIWNGAAVPMTRAPDASQLEHFVTGKRVEVKNGADFSLTTFRLGYPPSPLFGANSAYFSYESSYTRPYSHPTRVHNTDYRPSVHRDCIVSFDFSLAGGVLTGIEVLVGSSTPLVSSAVTHVAHVQIASVNEWGFFTFFVPRNNYYRLARSNGSAVINSVTEALL